MNKLIIKDIFGVTECRGKAIASSRRVAEIFGKRHDHVLRDIYEITDPKNGLSKTFIDINFELSYYRDSTNRKLVEYILTRDGFTVLAMGFTGKKAMQFKEAYINRFNEMEAFIKSFMNAKLEFPEFTDAIMAAHEEPKSYHFSNEINMINRIVLGMDAKTFKVVNNLPAETPSIRPYLVFHQIKAIENLQRFDIGLITLIPDYDER